MPATLALFLPMNLVRWNPKPPSDRIELYFEDKQRTNHTMNRANRMTDYELKSVVITYHLE